MHIGDYLDKYFSQYDTKKGIVDEDGVGRWYGVNEDGSLTYLCDWHNEMPDEMP